MEIRLMNVNECILSTPERRIELKDISGRSTLIERRQKPIAFYNARNIRMALHRIMLIKYLLNVPKNLNYVTMFLEDRFYYPINCYMKLFRSVKRYNVFAQYFRLIQQFFIFYAV